MLFEGHPVLAGVEHDASVQRRVGAWLVDAAVATVLSAAVLRGLLILSSPPGTIVHLADVPPAWIAPVALVVWILYRASSERAGASVGKRLFSVRVVHPSGKLGFARAGLRAITAPFDAVLGHLEREGPFDRRQELRIVRWPRAGLGRWLVPAGWLALAGVCTAWLLLTPTRDLLTELHALQAHNRCGQVPRQVIHFTDRGNTRLTQRCDRVMSALSQRARAGDAQAHDALAGLRYARDWDGVQAFSAGLDR